MTVLCLIANPADPALDRQLVEGLQREIGGEINWLHQRVACEIVAPKHKSAADLARSFVTGRPVDVAEVPLEARRKKLLIADMDSTMIEQECIDELADALGIKAQVSGITARAMNGEIGFEDALAERVLLLKGLELSRMEEIRREQITLAPGGRVLVSTMKAHGAHTALVSGGFTFFAEYFAKRIGFDEFLANTLGFDGSALNGKVVPPIIGKDAKVQRLQELVQALRIDLAATLAVGDGANDLPMLKTAGLGVALHAKPIVAAEANVKIDHGDLTALLYLQGYSDEDFVR